MNQIFRHRMKADLDISGNTDTIQWTRWLACTALVCQERLPSITNERRISKHSDVRALRLGSFMSSSIQLLGGRLSVQHTQHKGTRVLKEHLYWRYLFSTAIDQLLYSASQSQVAFLVQESLISCVEVASYSAILIQYTYRESITAVIKHVYTTNRSKHDLDFECRYNPFA